MMSAFFPEVPKHDDSSRHFQFYCNIVQNACDSNVAVYILVQPEEKYYLIWKAKPLTIQTGNDKW